MKKKHAPRVERPALTQLRSALQARQRKFADYLGRKTAYWNRGSKLTALILFCLVFGGISLLLLLKAIIHH